MRYWTGVEAAERVSGTAVATTPFVRSQVQTDQDGYIFKYIQNDADEKPLVEEEWKVLVTGDD